MTSFIERMKQARNKAHQALEFADSALAESRYDICLACPSLRKPLNSCAECGCFMVAKTKLKNVSCPLGKW